MSSTASDAPVSTRDRIRDAVAYCRQPHNLRRTIRIALIVGVLLTLINQGAVIISGNANAATWARCVMNFVVPFLVSNAGLLSGRVRPATTDAVQPGR